MNRVTLAIFCCGLALGAAAAEGAGFQTPLEVAAAPSRLAPTTPMTDVTLAGKRWIAAGQRGIIIYSDDGGKSWQQASVPVSVDLTALSFPTPLLGWVVGHGGVILHSRDGGMTWSVQLDGRSLGKIVLDYYRKKATAGDSSLSGLIKEAELMIQDGPQRAFMDVRFEDEQTGYVIGTFNLVLRTTDAGKTWVPMMEQTENPQMLHLYSIKKWGGALYIAGERGLLLRQQGADGRFKSLSTPYQGTYYGTVGNASVVVAFGLAGNAYRSEDRGRNWSRVTTGTTAILTSAGIAPNGGMLMTTLDGQVLTSNDDGRTFAPMNNLKGATYFSTSGWIGGRMALTGPRGVQVVEASRESK